MLQHKPDLRHCWGEKLHMSVSWQTNRHFVWQESATLSNLSLVYRFLTQYFYSSLKYVCQYWRIKKKRNPTARCNLHVKVTSMRFQSCNKFSPLVEGLKRTNMCVITLVLILFFDFFLMRQLIKMNFLSALMSSSVMNSYLCPLREGNM